MQMRHRDPMIALHVKTLAAVGDGAHQDRLPRPIVIAVIGLRRLLPRVALDGDQVEDARS